MTLRAWENDSPTTSNGLQMTDEVTAELNDAPGRVGPPLVKSSELCEAHAFYKCVRVRAHACARAHTCVLTHMTHAHARHARRACSLHVCHVWVQGRGGGAWARCASCASSCASAACGGGV